MTPEQLRQTCDLIESTLAPRACAECGLPMEPCTEVELLKGGRVDFTLCRACFIDMVARDIEATG